MITITPLSPALGAEVAGVDLAAPLDDSTVAQIRAAWLAHQVIVFRGQQLDAEAQLRFCRALGEIELTRTTRRDGREIPGVLFVANRVRDGFKGILPDGEMQFHTDQCYYEVPIAATSLYALEIPSQGGNTLFANAYRAYDALPGALKPRLDGLRALNVYDYAANAMVRAREPNPDAPRYVHPVVRTHPETGRKAIYVNRLMTDHIEGMDAGRKPRPARHAVRRRRAARAHLRARLAARRPGAVGQSLHAACAHRLRSRRGARAAPRRRARRPAVLSRSRAAPATSSCRRARARRGSACAACRCR